MQRSQFKRNSNHASTLFEIIIVIIMVGTLASFAGLYLLRSIEKAYSMEALVNISSIKEAIERCYISHNDYTQCSLNPPQQHFLDIEDPGLNPGAHFTYTAIPIEQKKQFEITAKRNSLNTINSGDMIVSTYDTHESSSDKTQVGLYIANRRGSGTFSSIK